MQTEGQGESHYSKDKDVYCVCMHELRSVRIKNSDLCVHVRSNAYIYALLRTCTQ